MKYSEIKLAEKGARKRKQKAAKDKVSFQNLNTMIESDMIDHMYNVAVNSNNTQYISFTAIDKIGINPRSVYNTPVGIYCYPLTKASGDPSVILDLMVTLESFEDIPYMKNSPYIYMFQAKNKEKGLILSEYTDEQLEADKQKLYAYLNSKNDQITEDIFDAIVKDSQDNALVETPGGYLWNLTRVSSLILSGAITIKESSLSTQNQSIINEYSPSRTQAAKSPIQWTVMLHKVLKYDYIDDSNDQGIIHENETTQAVFFNATTLSVSERFINPRSPQNPIKKAHVDKRPKGRKRLKGGKRDEIFPPDWNETVQSFSKEKSNGWLNLYRLAHKNSSSNPVISFSDIEREIYLQYPKLKQDESGTLAASWGFWIRKKYGISVQKVDNSTTADPDDQLNNDPKTAFIEF